MKNFPANIFILVVFLFSMALSATAQSLGDYHNSYVYVGGNTVILPSDYPVSIVRATAMTSLAFKGVLAVNPTTGALQVTNAQPAGTYTVTVRGFTNGGSSVTKTFTLRVLRQGCSSYILSNNATQASGSPITTGTSPFFNAIGDFDNNGVQDIIVANLTNSNNINIFGGDGSAGFSNISGSPFSSSAQSPEEPAVADFNGDGNADFAINSAGTNKVSIYLGNGTNGFTEAAGSPVSICTGTRSLTMADFNNDGKMDLATACPSSNSLGILLGNGDGTFSRLSDINVGFTVYDAVAGDFNGDGNADLAYCGTAGVVTIKGNGSGGFNGLSSFDIIGTPTNIAAGDFNGDGFQDLAIDNPAQGVNSVSMLRNDGAGNFTDFTSSPLSITNAPDGIAIADMNGDGSQDLFVGNQSTAHLIRGSGNTFVVGGSIPGMGKPRGFAVGDFNGNGFLDFAFTETFNNRMRVYTGGCPVTISTGSLPNAQKNVFYSTTISPATGISPFNFTAGGLPPGLSINSSTGVISGTPTQEGNFIVTADISDASQRNAIKQFYLYVGTPQIFIYPASLPNGNAGVPYSQNISAQYGNAPYTFAVTSGALPAGLTLNPNGTLSGTPTTTGTFNFTVTAADSGSGSTPFTASRNYSLTIDCSATLSALPNGSVGASYPNALTVTGGVAPYTFAVTSGALPTGLTLNSDGSFNGAPTTTGTFNFGITATGSTGCSATRLYSVTVIPAQIKDYSSAIIELGQNIVITPPGNTTQTTRLGVKTSSAFKGILTINQTTGVVTVTNAYPAGVYDVSVTAYDSTGAVGAKTFSLTVETRSSSSAVSFDSYSPGVGSFPMAIAMGDFNNDGKKDVVTANQSSNNISVLLSAGFASFAPAMNIAVCSAPTGVTVEDFNGDGNKDIAVVCYDSRNVIAFTGNGAGGFIQDSVVSIGSQPVLDEAFSSITAGDFNGDGNGDIAVANAGAGAAVITILQRNAANNGFDAPQNVATANRAMAVMAGDFNSDGKTDIAVSANLAATILYRNTTNNGFNRIDLTLWSGYAWSMALGDVSGDGKPDIVIGHNNAQGASVLLNTGNSFTTSLALRYQLASGTGVAIGNFDNSGKTDIAIADSDNNKISLISLNADNNGFTTGQTLNPGTGVFPWAIASTDFNNDNVNEMIFTGIGTNDVRVIRRHLDHFALPFEVMSLSNVYLTTPLNGSLPAPLPFQSAVGDFNNDGFQDVVAANSALPTVSVLFGKGNGLLGVATEHTVSANAVISSIKVGDFNGDGFQDIAASYSDGGNKLALLLNNAGTGFTVEQNNVSDSGHIAAGDFNSDGRQDLVIGGNTNVLVLLRNSANNGFVTGASFNPGAPHIEVGDFNGDGKLDIASTSNGGMVFLGNGSGGFSQEGSAMGAGDSVTAADFNNDGKTDLAFANHGLGTVSVMLRNAANNGFTLENGSTLSVGTNPQSLSVADFNGDGRQDLAVTLYETIKIYTRNSSNNGFTLASTNPAFGVFFMGIGDFNGDGRQDILTANFAKDTVSLYLRQSAINFNRRTLPSGVVNQAYSQSIKVGGGTRPYNFQVTGLPQGLSFNSNADGITISGVPETTGLFNVAVSLTDSTPFVEEVLSPEAANQASHVFPLQIFSPTSSSVSVSGQVTTANGQGIRNAFITMTDVNGNTRTTVTGAFGYYRFDDVPTGETYIFTVSAKRFRFSQSTQMRTVTEETTDVNFTANN